MAMLELRQRVENNASSDFTTQRKSRKPRVFKKDSRTSARTALQEVWRKGTCHFPPDRE